MITYGKQTIDEDDIRAVGKALRQPIITGGNIRVRFEETVADYVGAKYAVAFSSASAGLEAAFYILKGDYKHYTTSANTFLTSAQDQNFHFQDIDLKTGNMTTDFKTDIAVVVHYAGYPVDIKKVKAKRIIEDAAHALGSEYYGHKVGCCQWSDMTVFSFMAVKAVTTGEGGIVTTNDKTICRLLKEYRDFGRRKGIKVGEGRNYYLTEFQCALGLSQMKKLDKFIKRRTQIAKQYGFQSPPTFKSSWHLVPFLAKNRNKLRKFLLENQVSTQIHYRPLYHNPYFKNKKICKNAEYWFRHELSLPIYPNLKDKEQQKVINLIKKFYEDI